MLFAVCCQRAATVRDEAHMLCLAHAMRYAAQPYDFVSPLLYFSLLFRRCFVAMFHALPYAHADTPLLRHAFYAITRRAMLPPAMMPLPLLMLMRRCRADYASPLPRYAMRVSDDVIRAAAAVYATCFD